MKKLIVAVLVVVALTATATAAYAGSGDKDSHKYTAISVTNPNNSSSQEHIVLDFNALVCNTASNVNGAPLNNSFPVIVTDQACPAARVAALQVTVGLA